LLAGLALGLWFKANIKIKQLQNELTTLSTHFYELSKFVEKYQDVLKAGGKPAEPAAQSPAAQSDVKQRTGEADKADVKESQPETSETVSHALVPDPLLSQSEPDEPVKASPPEIKAIQPDISQSTTVSKPEPVSTFDSQTEEPYPLDRAISWLKTFFTTGNVLVKVGVLVLFFGVAFLIKYAADRDVFPIELRLAGVGLAGLILLVIGWRLREKNAGYALVLQGGALGVLYLTVFSALRLYSLLPPTLAFGILFVFSGFSAALAILQNSRALAVLGISGGFLAPILTSTGGGSHVGLFSYYLVLNLGILGIAWFRSWRLLNVVGFLFTFVVATAWGFKYYTPEFFADTEPFLIAFYLLYVAIAVLFAFKQPVELKGYVDSTLVFGVPLVGFGLQAGMVGHIEYALAWSSLSLAALYIGLASLLWHRMQSGSRLICEAFLAIGIMFATLTVPFALDAKWTAGTWALEGAAAVWIGCRQSRLLPRLLGYALQLAGGFAYLSSLQYSQAYRFDPDQLFVLNGDYIGALIVALSGLFVAYRAYSLNSVEVSGNSYIQTIKQHEYKLSIPFLIWGLLWWYLAGASEIETHISSAFEPFGFIVFVALSVFATQWLKVRYSWSDLRIPALGLLPALYILFPFVMFESGHPFGDWNLLSWCLALVIHYRILKQYDDQQTKPFDILHIAAYWLIVILLTVEAAWQVDDLVRGANVWWQIMIGLVPAALMVLMYSYGDKITWPVSKRKKLYQITATTPIGIAVWAWFVLLNLVSNGFAAPLNYIPLLNPLDIALAIQLLILFYWLRFPLPIENWHSRHWRFEFSQLFFALSIFLWLNTIWLRTAHHYWQIPFDAQYMMHSGLAQAGLSILWGVSGLLCMVYAARKLKRHVWIAGAVVMAAVVVKLFMLDLANSGTVERIVSFISVGILFLVVGYFAPVPPTAEDVSSDEGEKIEN